MQNDGDEKMARVLSLLLFNSAFLWKNMEASPRSLPVYHHEARERQNMQLSLGTLWASMG